MSFDGSDLLHSYAEAIRKAADSPIVAEWICCDPVKPDHDLCVKGDIARQMLRAVLADDPEVLFLPSGVADAVMAVRDEELEQLRTAVDELNQLRAEEFFAAGERTIEAWRHYSKHWRERAEKAEAANTRTRERLDALIAAGFGAVTDTLRELRAALDDTAGTANG